MTVALVYFAYLACLAAFGLSVPTARRIAVLILAGMAMLSVVAIGGPHVMPLIYVLIGYWLPAMLVRAPSENLGRRLLAFDYRLFGERGLAEFARKAPKVIVGYLELAYLFCYAVIPVGWAWLMLAGHQADADRFWTVVLLAAFVCYGALPWLPSRAPRAVEASAVREPLLIRKLNMHVLDRASVQWNTFPSGHTAASVAVALAVGIHVPLAGNVLGGVALSIAVGSVVGRYHYAADAIAGTVVAILAFFITSAVHGQ